MTTARSSSSYRGPASLGDTSHWPFFAIASQRFDTERWTARLSNLATTIPVGEVGAFATRDEALAAAEVALSERAS